MRTYSALRHSLSLVLFVLSGPALAQEPRIINAFTQTKVKALEELKTLTADEAWLEWATDSLPS